MSSTFQRAIAVPAPAEARGFYPMLIRATNHVKRMLKIGFGFFLLAAGAVMVVAPGPGLITIALGLAVLGSEYHWARRSLDYMKRRGVQLRDAVLARKVHNIEKKLDPQGHSELDPSTPPASPDKPTVQ